MGRLVTIDYLDLGIDYADSGPWRSYDLNTHGTNYDELLANATIAEIDQDGGDLACYGYDGCSNEVAIAVEEAIKAALEE